MGIFHTSHRFGYLHQWKSSSTKPPSEKSKHKVFLNFHAQQNWNNLVQVERKATEKKTVQRLRHCRGTIVNKSVWRKTLTPYNSATRYRLEILLKKGHGQNHENKPEWGWEKQWRASLPWLMSSLGEECRGPCLPILEACYKLCWLHLHPGAFAIVDMMDFIAKSHYIWIWPVGLAFEISTIASAGTATVRETFIIIIIIQLSASKVEHTHFFPVLYFYFNI